MKVTLIGDYDKSMQAIKNCNDYCCDEVEKINYLASCVEALSVFFKVPKGSGIYQNYQVLVTDLYYWYLNVSYVNEFLFDFSEQVEKTKDALTDEDETDDKKLGNWASWADIYEKYIKDGYKPKKVDSDKDPSKDPSKDDNTYSKDIVDKIIKDIYYTQADAADKNVKPIDYNKIIRECFADTENIKCDWDPKTQTTLISRWDVAKGMFVGIGWTSLHLETPKDSRAYDKKTTGDDPSTDEKKTDDKPTNKETDQPTNDVKPSSEDPQNKKIVSDYQGDDKEPQINKDNEPSGNEKSTYDSKENEPKIEEDQSEVEINMSKVDAFVENYTKEKVGMQKWNLLSPEEKEAALEKLPENNIKKNYQSIFDAEKKSKDFQQNVKETKPAEPERPKTPDEMRVYAESYYDNKYKDDEQLRNTIKRYYNMTDAERKITFQKLLDAGGNDTYETALRDEFACLRNL